MTLVKPPSKQLAHAQIYANTLTEAVPPEKVSHVYYTGFTFGLADQTKRYQISLNAANQ